MDFYKAIRTRRSINSINVVAITPLRSPRDEESAETSERKTPSEIVSLDVFLSPL